MNILFEKWNENEKERMLENMGCEAEDMGDVVWIQGICMIFVFLLTLQPNSTFFKYLFGVSDSFMTMFWARKSTLPSNTSGQT